MDADPGAFLKRLPVFLPLLHQCLEDGRLGAVGVNRGGDRVNGAGVETRCSAVGVNAGSDGVKSPDAVVSVSEERMEEEGNEEEDERGRENEGSPLTPEGRLESKGAGEGGDFGTEVGVGKAGVQNQVRDLDHLLFSSLSTLNKMCVECELTGCNDSLPQDMDAIWGEGRVN